MLAGLGDGLLHDGVEPCALWPASIMTEKHDDFTEGLVVELADDGRLQAGRGGDRRFG